VTQRDLEQRLRSAIRGGVDPGAPPWLQARIQAIPDTIPTAHRGASHPWLSLASSRAVSVAVVSAIVVALSVGLGLLAWRNLGTAPPTPPSPATWTGPVRADAGGMPVLSQSRDAETGWADGRDAAIPWADITAVRGSFQGQSHWGIELAGWPPRAEGLDPDQTVIEYGVVLDTNRDRVPDYEFGINNDAREAGEFRVWVTDLAAEHTNERVGPPNGFPVDFSYPDEQDPDGQIQPSMQLWFNPGTRPIGPPEEVLPSDQWQFYVWATVTEGGEVVAWDYAPDFGWLTATSP